MNMLVANFWTADDDATLVRLIRKGVSGTDAAKEIGRSRNAVMGRAWRKGLQFKGQGGRPAVKPVQSITRARFTDAEDKIIVALSAIGKSGTEIAKAIGRSSSSVIKRARLLGANVHAKKGPPKAPAVKVKKTFLHAGNIAAKKVSRAHDPAFCHVTPVVAVDPMMVALLDLSPSMCRFPVAGERADTLFCGHPQGNGSYCGWHAAIVYTAPEMRRRAA